MTNYNVSLCIHLLYYRLRTVPNKHNKLRALIQTKKLKNEKNEGSINLQVRINYKPWSKQKTKNKKQSEN